MPKLRAEIIATRDTGLIPEGMFSRLAGEKTIYEYAQSEAYPIERLVDLADKASSRDPAVLADLTAAMDDPHPIIRYWGAVGCLVLQDRAAPAKEKLTKLLADDWGDIRVAAAAALSYLGEAESALGALASALDSQEEYEVLAALNALDFIGGGQRDLERVGRSSEAQVCGHSRSDLPATCSARRFSRGPDGRPNIVLMMADDQGWADRL